MNGPVSGETRLSPEQKHAWLRLARSDNVGPITFAELIRTYGTAEAALEALPELSRRAGRQLRVYPAAEADREIAAVERHGARLVALPEPDYPPWLRQIDAAPPLVTIRGGESIFTRPMIAVIGSRNASAAGRKFATLVAEGLAERGLAVVSGLARGIDATAHEAALGGGTVAVLAGGLDRIYPPENIPLADRIIGAAGGHLSEMPMGHEPRARDFPRRNRLISGLALGVVVIEAAERSGTLITTRFAAEQGRTVFAVPGSPFDPRSAGTNRLLKDGAVVTTEIDDVIAVVEPMLDRPLQPAARLLREHDTAPVEIAEPESARGRVIEALGPSPIEVDEVIRFTGLASSEVQLVLIELDLAGRIERHAGGRVSLI